MGRADLPALAHADPSLALAAKLAHALAAELGVDHRHVGFKGQELNPQALPRRRGPGDYGSGRSERFR